MRIAVDVKGTLEGHKRDLIVRMMMFLKDKGWEVVVWSNSYGYAVDAVKGLSETPLEGIEPYNKEMKSSVDYKEEFYFDIAIEDDRSQEYLAAKHFIWVDEIPQDTPIGFLQDKLKEWYPEPEDDDGQA